jgi:hypothetical protein
MKTGLAAEISGRGRGSEKAFNMPEGTGLTRVKAEEQRLDLLQRAQPYKLPPLPRGINLACRPALKCKRLEEAFCEIGVGHQLESTSATCAFSRQVDLTATSQC